MFIIKEKYGVDRKILKYVHTRYCPIELNTIKAANSQMYNNIPREDSVIPL